jgi:hypothetical protein
VPRFDTSRIQFTSVIPVPACSLPTDTAWTHISAPRSHRPPPSFDLFMLKLRICVHWKIAKYVCQYGTNVYILKKPTFCTMIQFKNIHLLK